MATRRPIYRKQEPRSISKTGFLLCVLLAGAVLLVPTGGDVLRAAKMKVRDLVMRSTLVDLDACVVTADHALACTSDAVGVPLEVALRQMKDDEAQVAEERKQRSKAEGIARDLAMELARLNAQRTQDAAGDTTARFFPALVGEVKPTARSGADDPASVPQPDAAPAASSNEGDAPMLFTPPAEEN